MADAEAAMMNSGYVQGQTWVNGSDAQQLREDKPAQIAAERSAYLRSDLRASFEQEFLAGCADALSPVTRSDSRYRHGGN